MVDFNIGSVAASASSASSEKPESLPLARWQASNGQRVSSPRLDMLTADPYVAKLITLCDGSRDRKALISAMVEAHEKKEYQLNENDQPVTDAKRAKQIIESLFAGSIQNLANLGLLLPQAA